MTASADYWEECIAISCEEQGIMLTAGQLKCIAGDVEAAHENYGMAFGRPSSGDLPVYSELRKAKEDLAAEREKVSCKECGGNGRIITYGPYHSGDSECWKCRGDGRHAP